MFKSGDRLYPSLLFLFFAIFCLDAAFPAVTESRQLFTDSGTAHSVLHPDPPTHLHIVAVMVEFQPDSNRFTSGDGTFEEGSVPYLLDPGTPVDALPHDQGYFEAHLEFAKNYFQRVSAGNLTIDYQVLPNVYRLNKPMEEYSPVGTDPVLTPLAQLVRDTWEIVAADPSPGIDFRFRSGHDVAFVIFHAGIGRDIELTGTTLDRTPQDIPSVYLSTESLRELLQDPSFSGFELDQGNLLVDHSIILPRTLSRAGEDITGRRYILPLSLNGLLTAQIGRRAGLPYLFDTETGQSGIGRFGLMDGAGIFSYNGLFPPEPSAWEKVFMGWAEPFQLTYDHPGTLFLQAPTQLTRGDIAKVSISQNEYFLIENRNRDPFGSGVELTIRKPDGSIIRQRFTNSDSDFINQNSGFDDLLEPGVIVDVSQFDFSLPGGRAARTIGGQPSETDLNGGMLIWHIDEAVIRAGLQSGSVNNDPGHRGVELKEADGAQDIGRAVSTGFFQNEVNGSIFDFWWSSNNASVIIQQDTLSLYENRFGPGSVPDNRSHAGAPSHFELYDFSENRPLATFRIRPADPYEALYSLVSQQTLTDLLPYSRSDDVIQRRYPLAMIPIDSETGTCILIPGQNGFSTVSITPNSCPHRFIETGTPLQPLPLQGFNGFALAEFSSQTPGQMVLSLYQNLEGEWTPANSFQLEPARGFISLGEPGRIEIDGTSQRIDLSTQTVTENGVPSQRSETLTGTESRIEGNSLIIRYPGGEISHSLHDGTEQNRRLHTGLIQSGRNTLFSYLLSDGTITLYSSEDQFQQPVTLSDSGFIGWPSFADLNGDGLPEILFTDQNTGLLTAKNVQGAASPGFPITPPAGHQFSGSPLVADLNGNGSAEIVIQAKNNGTLSLFAYDATGERMDGFPLHVGGFPEPRAIPVHPLLAERHLVAVSPDGDLKMWFFPEMGDVQWASGYGSVFNNKITGQIDSAQIAEPNFMLLNPEETYNWPNPARNETHLRFETARKAQIRIKITTLSGRLIHDQTVQSGGLGPEEILLNTSGWPSGAYFALIEASDGSKKENKMVKIAVVK